MLGYRAALSGSLDAELPGRRSERAPRLLVLLERTHGAAPAASSATQYPDVRLARFPWERLQALQTQISG
jgi:hypothetical protein